MGVIRMNKTTKDSSDFPFRKSSVDTKELQEMLSCGRVTAVQIGNNAGAKIQIGRRVLWNVRKVNAYLDSISE